MGRTWLSSTPNVHLTNICIIDPWEKKVHKWWGMQFFGYLYDNEFYFKTHDIVKYSFFYIFSVSFIPHWVWFTHQIFRKVLFIVVGEPPDRQIQSFLCSQMAFSKLIDSNFMITRLGMFNCSSAQNDHLTIFLSSCVIKKIKHNLIFEDNRVYWIAEFTNITNLPVKLF